MLLIIRHILEVAVGTLSFLLETLIALFRQLSRFLLSPIQSLRAKPRRFVPFRERKFSTNLGISLQFFVQVQKAKWRSSGGIPLPGTNWRGVVNLTDPFSFSIYPLLLWELKPATIIELGAYKGGSALWMADTTRAMGFDCHIYSYDIDTERIEAEDERVTFLQVDSNNLASFDLEMLKGLPHPWLVIEDAHVNVFNVLAFFNRLMHDGDYIVVEDSLEQRKYMEMRRFALAMEKEIWVDTGYADLFGYNVGWNINGFLMKSKTDPNQKLAARSAEPKHAD